MSSIGRLYLLAGLAMVSCAAPPQSPPIAVAGMLTAEQSQAIAARLRPCVKPDPGSPPGQHVWLTVVTDEQGAVRRAYVAEPDMARVSAEPSLRSFAARVAAAAMSCGRAAPFPGTDPGRLTQLTFDFRG